MELDDILNSDDYKRGLEQGKADALEGKNRHNWEAGFKAGASAKYWIHGSGAIDTFKEGYNAGYETVFKSKIFNEVSQNKPIKNEIHNSNNNINLTNMARGSQHSFAYQIELAEDLKSYLHGFQERLGVIAGQYDKKFNNLGNVMMDEFHTKFEKNFHQTIRIMSALVDQINEQDIPCVESYIAYLESGL